MSRDAADLVPVRLVEGDEEDGRVVLRRPKGNLVGRAILRAFRVDPILTIRLDPLGSDVWRAIDGRRVSEILETLRGQHPEEADLPARLGSYLSTLASHRLIRLDLRA